MELGVYTFADVPMQAPEAAGQRLRDLLEEIALADAVGLDAFGLGEHHRPDYAISAPAVVLAAAAARTKKIRLSSAVTVLSSEDPVRVYQQFATLDLISNGRAEIMVGRGSFIESYPLFGYGLDDYDQLFTEKLDLLLKIRANERVSWSGETRAPLHDLGVYPRTGPIPITIAVGGTPHSVIRAGTLGLPLAIAIIGGMPERFGSLVDLYRAAGANAGHAPEALKVSINSHGFIAETSDEAADTFFPYYTEAMMRLGKERGWPPTTRGQFEAGRTRRGALLVGTPEEVAAKILFEYDIFKQDRFMLQMDVGAVPHKNLMRTIELLGTKLGQFELADQVGQMFGLLAQAMRGVRGFLNHGRILLGGLIQLADGRADLMEAF
eukprot:gene6212-6279_t